MRAVRRQLKKIGVAVPTVLANEDPEDVHQMRVAVGACAPTRRRSTTRRCFAPSDCDGSRGVYSPLATALGDVRDLDILLQRVEALPRPRLLPQVRSGMLRDELLWRRVKARRRLQRALDSRTVRRRTQEAT